MNYMDWSPRKSLSSLLGKQHQKRVYEYVDESENSYNINTQQSQAEVMRIKYQKKKKDEK